MSRHTAETDCVPGVVRLELGNAAANLRILSWSPPSPPTQSLRGLDLRGRTQELSQSIRLGSRRHISYARQFPRVQPESRAALPSIQPLK